ncbi:hypothetical protein BCS58_08020 [Enterovibrio norvegicus]|uniref:hypothetical protein n=1 Tax=Enterovibrio norvegicus TaxID=188144 RepID=UPI0038998172
MKLGKILLLLSAMVLLSACSIPSYKSKEPKYSDPFDSANHLACRLRHSDQPTYCSCFVKVMSKNTPESTKLKIRNFDASASEEVAWIFRNSRDELNECHFLGSKDLKIDTKSIPKDVLDFAKENEGKLLTPANRMSLTPELDLGYKFQIKYSLDTEKPSTWLVMDKKEGNAYYFSNYSNDGKLKKTKYIFKYEHGIKYYLHDGEYKESFLNKCSFSIGKCTFKDDNKNYVVLTEFKDGVWINNRPSYYGADREYIYTVYGSDGLPLFVRSIYRGIEKSDNRRVTPEEYPD